MARNLETNIQNSILLGLSGSGHLVWRNQVGVFRGAHDERRIRVGVPGQGDIMAVVPVTVTEDMVGQTIGLAVNIEVKTERKGSAQSAQQKRWEGAWRERGGLYLIARSSDEAASILNGLLSRLRSGSSPASS